MFAIKETVRKQKRLTSPAGALVKPSGVRRGFHGPSESLQLCKFMAHYSVCINGQLKIVGTPKEIDKFFNKMFSHHLI